jgi:SMODS-associated and fused to various effectors sensor domain
LDAEAASKTIPEPERIKLWVRAGGRCEFCNAYLLEDELPMLTLNLGELAHNVGRKRSAASPRGLGELPVDQRNLAENLLLLCAKHHKVIDDKVSHGEFTVEELRRIKSRHEDRIRYLTELIESDQTVIVRAIGDVRGAFIELNEQSVWAAVFAHARRYPFFSLGYRGDGVEIDLRQIPGEGTSGYWQEAEGRITAVVHGPLRAGIERNEIKHLSVFGLARIPLLALLGYHLDDKIPVDLYQKHRDSGESWSWDASAETVSFETDCLQEGDAERVVLVLSLSGTITLEELPPAITAGATIYTIRPIGVAPNRNILRSHASVDTFTQSYHAFLSELERDHPTVRVLPVFPSVPVSAAISLGRGLMRDSHPTLQIYDRDREGYTLALEING